MNSGWTVAGKGLPMVLPALGLGWLVASRCWAQADAVAAAPPASALSASADAPVAPAQSILKTPDDAKTPQSMAAVSSSAAITSAAGSEVHKLTVEVKDLAERLARLTTEQRRRWDESQAALPAFCQDWERMLHDREVNNLAHLEWQQKQGYQTATYTGYGKVRACQAKESDEGVPICKVTYQEMNYYLAGKSIEQAMAHPKLLSTTNTLEIFSWENDRWFY